MAIFIANRGVAVVNRRSILELIEIHSYPVDCIFLSEASLHSSPV